MIERRIEVMVFDGCPNISAALDRARAAVSDSKVPATVELVHVESDDEAQRQRFLGSPTVRVDGRDIDPSAKDRDDFGMQCRVYSVSGRLDGAPPTEWIASALRGEAPRVASSPHPARGGCCAPSESERLAASCASPRSTEEPDRRDLRGSDGTT